jgi:hypothetical protein
MNTCKSETAWEGVVKSIQLRDGSYGERDTQALSEMFLRYGPEKDPNFIVSLFKHAGDGGWVEDFHYPISEKDIRDRYPEGGRFQVVIKGSHPRTQQPGHVKEQVIVDVAPRTPALYSTMTATLCDTTNGGSVIVNLSEFERPEDVRVGQRFRGSSTHQHDLIEED